MSFRRFTTILLGATVAFTATGLFAFAAPAMADGTTLDGFEYVAGPGNTATITDYTGADPIVEIPDTIIEGAVPYSVTAIGNNAFAGKVLDSVVIPNSVLTIGTSAFGGSNLQSIVIGTSVTTIGLYAFDTNALKTVVIPDSVVTIRDYAFYANELTSVVFGNSVSTIGVEAFENNLLTTVTLPSSVTSIGAYAFDGNPDFVSAVFDGDAPTTGFFIFGTTPAAVTVFYYDGATGFTPTWTNADYLTQVVSATSSTLTLAPGTRVLPDGIAAFTATLTVVDGSAGNPVAGFPSAFTLPAGVTASASGCITDAIGQCTFTFTSTTAGTYPIGTLANRLTANATFGALPGPAGTLGLAATGAETSPVPYAAGGALLFLGLILTTVAIRRRKAVR